MILRFEVDEVCYVRGRGALSLARVTQAGASRANRFVFTAESVAIESTHFEVIEKERRAVFSLPLPIVQRRQRSIESKFLFGMRRVVSVTFVEAAVLFALCP